MNVQANQKIDTVESKIDIVESTLNKKIKNLQSDIAKKFDDLQYSIARLTNQQQMQEKGKFPSQTQSNPKGVHEVSSSSEPTPIKLNPSAIAQATNSPLPAAPSPDLVHILPTPVAHSTLETPTVKAIPSALPAQNFRKLVASIHIAWHIGWLIPKPSWFRFGAPRPQQFHQLHLFQQPPKA